MGRTFGYRWISQYGEGEEIRKDWARATFGINPALFAAAAAWISKNWDSDMPPNLTEVQRILKDCQIEADRRQAEARDRPPRWKPAPHDYTAPGEPLPRREHHSEAEKAGMRECCRLTNRPVPDWAKEETEHE